MTHVRSAPYRPLEQLSPQEYYAVPPLYLHYRECVHCGQGFHEYENRGQLQCHLHTGVLRYDVRRADYVYSCCGRAWNARGCTQADHLDQVLSDDLAVRHQQLVTWALVVVPLDLFLYGLVPPRRHCIVMRVESPQPRQLNVAMRFAHQSVVLQSEAISLQIAQELSRAPALLQMLSRRTPRQNRRDAAIRDIERRMNPKRGPQQQQGQQQQAEEEEEEVEVPQQFIPFLVLTRLAL